MPSVVSHVPCRRWHGHPRSPLDGRGIGGRAVGLGPAGPRPRRTFRPLRTRRRPDGGGRPRRPRLRPRGNGGSGGRRGHVDRWEQYHDDLAERVAAVRTVAGTRPVVLYGHSMGGLIVLGYLLSERPKAGPGGPLVAGSRHDARLVEEVARAGHVAGRPRRWPSRTESTARRCRATRPSPRPSPATPLPRKRAPPASLPRDSPNRHAVRRDYAGLTLPTLVLHGLDDGLVPAQASEILGTLPNVERRTYPGLRHELHNEPEGPAIVDEIIDWIRARTAVRATIPA